MTDYFVPQQSRLFIFERLMCCHVCGHDVFVPQNVYLNVEKPGRQVVFQRYLAICARCGFAIMQGDPSRYDAATDTFLWALGQEYLEPQLPLEVEEPVISVEDLVSYKEGIHLALQLLVRRNLASDEVFALCETEDFLALAQLFEQEATNVRECYVVLLSLLMQHRIVASDALIEVVQRETPKGIAKFLREVEA